MANLKQKVELYDPHPGFAGAAVPLPKAMKDAADELNGQSLVLEDVLTNLSPVAEEIGGTLEVVEKYNFIGFRIKESSGREHFYRLIMYRI